MATTSPEDPGPVFERMRRRGARRTPCRKSRYRNETEARAAAKRLRRYGHGDQRAYQCSLTNCAAWHLSTKPERGDQAIARFLANIDWPTPAAA